jgi:hypothetical protein
MIIILILFILSILIHLKLKANLRFAVKIFQHANTLTFGKKRKGKDLLTQAIIRERKAEYFANITYGYKYNHIELSEISLYPNTYENFINGKITKIKWIKKREKVDIYIDDVGNKLPSQYNHVLNKKYPSMPLYYSLSGHAYDSNIHCNYNGAYTRLWDKIREQADDYFRALMTVKIGPFLFSKYRYFEEEQSAKNNLLPMPRKFFSNKEYNSLQKQFEATNGFIKDFWIVQPLWKIKYDTRFYKRVFFYVDKEDYTKRELKRLRKLNA